MTDSPGHLKTAAYLCCNWRIPEQKKPHKSAIRHTTAGNNCPSLPHPGPWPSPPGSRRGSASRRPSRRLRSRPGRAWPAGRPWWRPEGRPQRRRRGGGPARRRHRRTAGRQRRTGPARTSAGRATSSCKTVFIASLYHLKILPLSRDPHFKNFTNSLFPYE